MGDVLDASARLEVRRRAACLLRVEAQLRRINRLMEAIREINNRAVTRGATDK